VPQQQGWLEGQRHHLDRAASLALGAGQIGEAARKLAAQGIEAAIGAARRPPLVEEDAGGSGSRCSRGSRPGR
jgi:hypothetical protein